MSLLTILLVVFLVLLVLGVGALWVLRIVIRRWLVNKVAAQDAARGGMAARITLMPTAQPWRQAGTEPLIDALTAAGYVEVGRFDVPEIQTMRLWAASHPDDGSTAAVYDHGTVPPFFDLVRVYDDYATCTVTTNPIHDPANVPPDCSCIADRTLSPASARVVLCDQPLREGVMRVDAGNFTTIFAELYARSIEHILTRNQPDAAKMRETGRRLAEVKGLPAPELDDAQMDLAVELHRVSRLAALQEAILDRFARSGEMEAGEWARLRDRVVVVHDLLGRVEAAEIARAEADRRASQPIIDAVLARELPPIDTFEQITAQLPQAQRLRLVGEVDHPLYAQIVVADAG